MILSHLLILTITSIWFAQQEILVSNEWKIFLHKTSIKLFFLSALKNKFINFEAQQLKIINFSTD